MVLRRGGGKDAVGHAGGCAEEFGELEGEEAEGGGGGVDQDRGGGGGF